jgi:4-amino-4-deoxy-L-arabinose transferase-like glycosyltransferase
MRLYDKMRVRSVKSGKGEKVRKAGMVNRVHWAAILVAVVTVVCLAPFVNKAFHVDDPLFIWTAKHIQSDPVNFYGFKVNWYGAVMPISEVTKNPPLACYYIALIGSLLGFGEIALHIAFLVPAAMAAVGTYYLARKFCSRPGLAALAAVLSPGFLVSSTNIMCDTMMLAFWVWAVVLWIEGIERNNQRSLFFAAMLAAGCALTKYYGMALLPMLAVYSIIQKRKFSLSLMYLLVPIMILAGYQLLTYHLYGRGMLMDAADYAFTYNNTLSSKFFFKVFTGLLFTGGCFAAALFYYPLLWPRRVVFYVAAATLLLIFLLSFAGQIGKVTVRASDTNNIKWVFLVQIGLMAAAGVNILALAGADLVKHKNASSALLALWVLGTFIFAAIVNWSVNARSILPMAPAVGILLMRRIEQYKAKAGFAAIWLLLPAAVVSLLVCWADYSWANTARLAAKTIHKNFANPNRPLWFQGHWGFQYYMESLGDKAVDYKHQELFAKGDIIISPQNNTNLEQWSENAVSMAGVFKFNQCRYLATMNELLGAGFYSDAWGPLPFAAGTVGPEPYYVFIIK